MSLCHVMVFGSPMHCFEICKRGHRAALVLICCAASLMIGCAEKSTELPVFPLQGTVMHKGKPLANALVALHPVNPTDPRATTCRATTGADGKFTISTYNANDGAPAGEYKVTIECYQLKGSGSSLEPGPNILPAKYSQPSTTDLSVQVAEGSNNSPTFELK